MRSRQEASPFAMDSPASCRLPVHHLTSMRRTSTCSPRRAISMGLRMHTHPRLWTLGIMVWLVVVALMLQTLRRGQQGLQPEVDGTTLRQLATRSATAMVQWKVEAPWKQPQQQLH
jgi:hypothetical protein